MLFICINKKFRFRSPLKEKVNYEWGSLKVLPIPSSEESVQNCRLTKCYNFFLPCQEGRIRKEQFKLTALCEGSLLFVSRHSWLVLIPLFYLTVSLHKTSLDPNRINGKGKNFKTYICYQESDKECIKNPGALSSTPLKLLAKLCLTAYHLKKIYKHASFLGTWD